MKLLIDDAHIDQIRRCYEYYPIDGVTTNPSILARVGGKPFDVLTEIRDFIGEDAELHVQAVARRAEDIVKEAERIVAALGSNTYVKIPAIEEGFKAMKMLLDSSEIPFTATAIYTPLQALIAGKCGASYVAPYVNRIDNMGFNGVNVAKQINFMLKENDMETEVIAASFKNSQQILELCEYGIGAATVAPEILNAFVNNAAIDSAIDKFISDFESLVGKGRTMCDA